MLKAFLPGQQELNELIQKLTNIPIKIAFEKVQQLAKRLPQEITEKLLRELKLKQDQFDRKIDGSLQRTIQLCKDAIHGPKIRIEISRYEILSAQNSPQQLISGKVFVNIPHRQDLEADCFVASGRWHKLAGLNENTINIVDHLDKLLPTNQGNSIMGSKGPIGLITFQNGMMNTLDDFKKICSLIVNQFPEAPLCIGLHNPTTENIVLDMVRFNKEPLLNQIAVYSLCQMFKTFAYLLPKINPNLLWTHFAHSEAGLIANAVFTLCEESWINLVEARKYIKNNLITATYGAVKPIPDDYVFYAMNTYSKTDVALFFGQNYLDRKYDDRLLSQISEDRPYDSVKNHQGKTYKIRLIESKTKHESYVKMPDMPEVLTCEQRLSMTWLESIANLHELDDKTRITNLVNKNVSNEVNYFLYSIVDHGFEKDSYQSAFKNNVKYIRDLYGISNSKGNW